MSSKKCYIVWNEAKNEGVIFVGEGAEQDALQCKHGMFRGMYSAIGQAFYEAYDEDERAIQEIELPE